ncbi:diaminopimelate decarboxylase [Pelomicrobium sp. G1]|uniref:diaminopimelate decarboxylase n=1 Tax=unclassified Pelomicrobium TaxID=2815318 RepID=UPI003F76F1BF
MSAFHYRDGVLHAEDMPLTEIAARFGTPCFVYSRAAFTEAYRAFDQALAGHPHLVCYAVKANSNLAILDLLARLGSGFDIVSGGELKRVLAAGGDARRVVFSGVGKTEAEMREALAAGVLCFNVESESELQRLNRVAAALSARASVSLRVNPDVDPKTHPYIATGLKENKFGVPFAEALPLYREARRLPHLAVAGIGCHIGSQLTELDPFVEAARRVLELADRLAAEGMPLAHVDLGGGLGIRYRDERPPSIEAYGRALVGLLRGRRERLIVEPGRALAGNAGVLVTRVEYLKHGETKNFAVVDAAMNDLMRPSLYDAYHEVLPVVQEAARASAVYDVVGPVCESGDFLARDRELALAEGDLLAIGSAGAYGMSMSSNYNTRPRAAEVMADRDRVHLIRSRETVEQLIALERRLPD